MSTKPNDTVSTTFTTAGHIVYEGLTKREYFAAMALQGLITGYFDNQDMDIGAIARTAVLQADTLIEALNQEQK